MIPRSITILGETYKIRRKRMKFHAWIDFDAKTIWLKSGTTTDKAEASLLHEVIHGILFQSGNSYQLNSNQEESLVLALETGLSLAGYRLQQ